MQLGKKTSGDMIDPEPESKEGFATATFDLEAIRWQRARYTSFYFLYRREVVNLTSRTPADIGESVVEKTSHCIDVAFTCAYCKLSAMVCSWGLFRDRRPDLYGPLLTLDGSGGRRTGCL